MDEWTHAMFREGKDGQATINTIMKYSPLVQAVNRELALARRNNELTGRFTKRMTRLALGVAALCLLMSITSLVVAVLAQIG